MTIQDKKYIVGSSLLLLAFIASVISFYLLVFTWPVYLLGAILVSISSQRIMKKILVILLPIILYLPATFLFLYIYNYTSPKLFLIPKNYSGTLRIIFNENCGEKYGLENGKKVIKFPQDGVLILNEEFDGGTNKDDEYYSFDEYNQRVKMTNVNLGGSGITSVGNLINKDNPADFQYVEYYTQDKSQYDYKSQQKFDSITSAKVVVCRKK